MSSGPPAVDSAGAIRTRLASLDDSQKVPGTLTKWADGADNKYWEFVGNGETTSTDFVHTALQRESQDGNKEVHGVAESRAFAQSAATALLATDTPDQPIPRGEVKELALKDLVQLIAPFLQTYATGQRSAGRAAGSGRPTEGGPTSEDERSRVATGQVVSQGLTLPLD